MLTLLNLLQVRKLPQKLKEELLANFNVEGVQQITRADIAALSDKLVEQFSELLDARLRQSLNGNPPEAPVAVESPPSGSRFKTFMWGGRFHMVPEGWKLPRPPLKHFYLLWHHGYDDDQIQPLKNLKKYDLSKPDWVQVTRCRRVIHDIEETARAEGIVDPGVSDFAIYTKARLNEIFDESYEKLIRKLYGDDPVHRKGEKAIGTLYNRSQK